MAKRTEQAYVSWSRRFILANGKRHPQSLGWQRWKPSSPRWQYRDTLPRLRRTRHCWRYCSSTGGAAGFSGSRVSRCEPEGRYQEQVSRAGINTRYQHQVLKARAMPHLATGRVVRAPWRRGGAEALGRKRSIERKFFVPGGNCCKDAGPSSTRGQTVLLCRAGAWMLLRRRRSVPKQYTRGHDHDQKQPAMA
jgi:hypothetical protein